MRKTILDLKMKVITSEPEGVYITPADSKYTIPELKERMVTVVEEQQYAVLRFLSLVSDFKVGDEKQYIGQIIDLNKIPNLGESMIIAAPTGSGKTKAITNMIHKATTFYKRLKEAFIMTNSTPNFTGRNVPIKEIAKATGKDPQFIRIGIQRGIFNFGYAFKKDGSSEYNYLCPDKKVWEELGYFKDVSNNN